MSSQGTQKAKMAANRVAPVLSEPNGGSAFPSEQHETGNGNWNQTFDPGMSLRDYFAAKALPVILTVSHENPLDWEVWTTRSAVASYEIADAMLKARIA